MTAQAKKEKGNKQRLVLLDSHAILHRAYHALPEFSSSKGEPTGALYGLSSMLIKIISDLKPDYIVSAYDLPGPTYRHEAYEDYKAGRPKSDEELVSQIKRSRDIFTAFGIPIYDSAGFEADDILGTIVEKTKKESGLEIIIASGDMDTLQLVEKDRVKVFTLKKGISDTILYDEKSVFERFGFKPELLPDFKGLRGDPSDNIVGVKGIGEKTATILIQNFGSIEEIYKKIKKDEESFKKAGLTQRIMDLLKENEEEAVFSKMLATIRRDAPIDFVLPEKTWREGFSMEKAEELFSALDFRTLGARLKETLNKKYENINLGQGTLIKIQEEENIPQNLLEETLLALWVLDSNITNPTIEDIYRYAKTRSFKSAREKILAEISAKKLSFVYEEIEKPLIPIIKEMENYGVKIDKKYLLSLSKEYHKELKRLEEKIWELAGEKFNIASPKQLGAILFEKLGLSVKNQKKTGTGMKSTRESELEKMKELHPIISHILEYREFAKLLSTYIDSIPSKLDKNERLHSNLRQTGTTTGRMSSTDPNLQNIPIKTELGRNIRKAFIAEKGFVLSAFDYSQIELRVAAILSKDEKLLNIFKNKEDAHASVASFVFGVPLEKVDKEMRRQAKVINFGILYGMGVNALRQNLGGTREEAQKFYNDYFKTFKGLASYLENIKSSAERLGYTETLFGRRRYFEGIKSKIPFIKASAERMAINAPFQGTAADIIKISMQKIYEMIEEKNLSSRVRMILQVHDELLFEIAEGDSEKIIPEIKRIMENVLPKEKSQGVVCEAKASVGENWAELKDFK